MGRYVYMESIEEHNARIGQEPQGPKINKGYAWCLVPFVIGILLMFIIKCSEQ